MSHELLLYQISIFVLMILGHFVGDYLLQTHWMSSNKSEPGWLGHIACSYHVMWYTLAIACCISRYTEVTLLMLAAIAIPHWIIDRFGLGWKLLKWKNGYEMRKSYDPECPHDSTWKVAFAAPVYIMNDNALHFVSLWLTVLLFVR